MKIIQNMFLSKMVLSRIHESKVIFLKQNFDLI